MTSPLSRARALLELAAKRTPGPLQSGDPDANNISVAGALCPLLHLNRFVAAAGDPEYLVAIWDLAPVLAEAYIDGHITLRDAAKALVQDFGRANEAERICRSLMTAGLAAVEQARLEEREACLRILADEYTKPQAFSLRNAAERIRARGEP